MKNNQERLGVERQKVRVNKTGGVRNGSYLGSGAGMCESSL